MRNVFSKLLQMRSLFVIAGLLLGLAVGFQNCSGPTFDGGAAGGKPALSTSTGEPQIETPLGDTKREVGGEGYTGKIFVQLGTCGEEKNAVMFMVRVNEDKTATVLREDCASAKTRLLAVNQYTVTVIDATQTTLTYTTAKGDTVTLPSYETPPPAGAELTPAQYKIMIRRVSVAGNTRQDYYASDITGPEWAGFGVVRVYVNPTATRLSLYQCRETVGDQLYYFWDSADCGGGEQLGLVGYFEPAATSDATVPYYACYQSNGAIMIVQEYAVAWCGTVDNQTFPPTVPTVTRAYLMGFGPKL